MKTGVEIGENSFALRVHGNSMLNLSGPPSIPRGFILIVDPDFTGRNEDIVVAKLDTSAKTTLKKLIIEHPHKLLKSFNLGYRVIKLHQNSRIVGVVRHTLFNFWKTP